MESIITAIITGVLTLVGTIITVVSVHKNTVNELKIEQAKIETNLAELTREVREHNNFARRMPVIEEQLRALSRRLEEVEKR